MREYVVVAEIEAETSEEAAGAFLAAVEQYSGGIVTERPFSIILCRRELSLMLEKLEEEAEISDSSIVPQSPRG